MATDTMIEVSAMDWIMPVSMTTACVTDASVMASSGLS